MSIKRLKKEFNEDRYRHPLIKSLGPIDSESDWSLWTAEIEGPANSPYEGGSFSLAIEFPQDYPFKPPRVEFTTKIYHCSVHPTTGRIALGILKDYWSPALSINIVLSSICQMLLEPEPQDTCYNPSCPLCEISSILKQHRELYESTAREWTQTYAMKSQENEE